ncbi:MAG: hypothetical protein SFU20_03420 [Chitinophagaceae bacterium]|nr:hypothetical protein [Chitinophagaceae bacterium]
MKNRIKKSVICRGIENYSVDTSLPGYYVPQVGDLAVFEVIKIGKHKNIQGDQYRNITILPGDLIMAAFGTRYATEQFEGYVPDECLQEFHILGAGGTIGIIKSMNSKFHLVGPTIIRIVGYVVNEANEVINTRKLKQPEMHQFMGIHSLVSKVILSVGSSMDSGKTTTAAYLTRGLKAMGKRVAFIKLTGTIYTKDTDLVYDLGAEMVTHFGEMGFPSTYLCSATELLDLYETLLSKVQVVNPDYVVIEIADGLFQRETKMLLTNKRFTSSVDHVVYSCGDSLAAIHGIEVLKSWGIRPVFLSGLFTTSPLLVKEVNDNSELPVYSIDQLGNGQMMGCLEQKLMASA